MKMALQPINPEVQLLNVIEINSNTSGIKELNCNPVKNGMFEMLKAFDYSEKYSNIVKGKRMRNSITNNSLVNVEKSVNFKSIDDTIEAVVAKSNATNIITIDLSSSDESGLNEEKERAEVDKLGEKSPFLHLTQYCPSCDKLLVKHKRDVRDNCEKCSSKLLYECTICNRRYPTKINVYSHLKTKYDCRKRPDLHCSECDYTSIHKGFLKQHMHIKHISLNDLVPCSKCGRHFKRKINAREHELSCGNAPYLACAYCDFKTTYRISFRIHMKNHIIDPEKGSCLINENYEQILIDPSVELSHIWKPGDTSKIILNKIKFRSTNKKSAEKKRYIDLYYRGLVKMFCRKCKKTTGVRARKFENCENCQTDFLYECGLCASKFNTCVNVIRHLRDRHTNWNLTTTYVCRICDKIYNDFKKASNHESMCKRCGYACDACPFKTKTAFSLKQHREKWHFGPLKNQHRPCPHCGRHMRYDPGKVTILACNYCH